MKKVDFLILVWFVVGALRSIEKGPNKVITCTLDTHITLVCITLDMYMTLAPVTSMQYLHNVIFCHTKEMNFS